MTPTCGAKARSNGYQPCRQPAGLGTDHLGVGRCKWHGGKTPIAHGRYSEIERQALGDFLAEAREARMHETERMMARMIEAFGADLAEAAAKTIKRKAERDALMAEMEALWGPIRPRKVSRKRREDFARFNPRPRWLPRPTDRQG